MKRRTLLLGAGGAVAGVLVVGAVAVVARDSHFKSRATDLGAKDGTPLLAGWVKLDKAGIVTVYVPHSDMGQGSLTALAMMVAEELDADWAKVRVEQAPADPAFANRFFIEGFLLKGNSAPAFAQGAAAVAFGEIARLAHMQVTGGSASVRFTGQMGLRSAGAAAREMLLSAAAAKLSVPASELTTQAGVVTHAASGRKVAYAELAGAASQLAVPSKPKLKDRSEFRIVGKAPPRLDIPDKTQGKTRYGIDVQLPGMLVASVMASPVHGETLQACDETPALKVKGVRKVVKLPNVVAVVADGYWQAIRGLRSLKPVFTRGASTGVTSASIASQFADALANGKGKSIHSQGDVAKASGEKLAATYSVPFLHHATMEPINVTAKWDGGKLEVWGSEQDALGARNNLVDISNLPLDDVTFHPMMLGGGFGRRSAPKKDHLMQAVELAKAMSPAPVKLIWSREEDFAQGAYRPAIATRIEATLTADGRIGGWSQRFIDSPDLINEGYPIPYDVPNQKMEAVASPTHVRHGAWRSVAHSQHGFFTESFIDELAAKAKMDPYEFRRRNLKPGSRHLKVLDAAARKAGWGTALPQGRSRGIAIVESFGSVVAEVIEASMSPAGEVQVHRVTAAVDCGYVVHADTATQQVQSAILMGLSAALGEAITIKDGAVVQRSFPDYPMMSMAKVPQLDIFFVETGAPLGGLGEVGLPPAAPALANALFAGTGQRMRALPVRAVGQAA